MSFATRQILLNEPAHPVFAILDVGVFRNLAQNFVDIEVIRRRRDEPDHCHWPHNGVQNWITGE